MTVTFRHPETGVTLAGPSWRDRHTQTASRDLGPPQTPATALMLRKVLRAMPENKPVDVPEIIEATGKTYHSIAPIIRDLRSGGYITTHRPRGGTNSSYALHTLTQRGRDEQERLRNDT